MAVEIIIQLVLYRDEHFLPGLANSLREQTFNRFSVFALNNGGDAGVSKLFKELFPDDELITSSENLGFAGGHNLLLNITMKREAPFVLVVNTDVELHPDFLKNMYAQAGRFPRVDAFGPLICNGANGIRLPTVQNYRLFMNFSTAQKKSPDVGKSAHSRNELPVSSEVDYLSGVALMLRTRVLRKIPLWDESLFLYGEERDFFCRFRRAGHRAMVVRDAVCWHFHDWSARNPRSYQREYYYLRRNRVLYFRKYNFTYGLVRFLLSEIFVFPVTLWWTIRKGGFRMFFFYWLGIYHGLRGKSGRFDGVI